jgi:hypothetical protein
LIPSLLADSNFSQIKNNDCQFTIVTREEDKKLFLKNKEFKKLKTITKVKFIYIDEIIKIQESGIVIHHAFEKAVLLEARPHMEVNFIFLTSDTIHASENLKYLFSLAKKGIRCVVGANLRISLESGIKNFVQDKILKNGFLKFKSGDLVDLAFSYLHPFTLSGFWNDSEKINISVNKFYWEVPNYGVISRNYLLQPIMLRPEVKIQSINGFLDYGLIPLAIKNKDNIHIITNSNNYCWIEVEKFLHNIDVVSRKKYDPLYVAQFLQYWVTAEHVNFSKKSINYYFSNNKEGDVSAIWKKHEVEVDSTIKLVNSYFDRPFYSGLDHPYWRKAKFFSSFDPTVSKKSVTIFAFLKKSRTLLAELPAKFCFISWVIILYLKKKMPRDLKRQVLLIGNLDDSVFQFISKIFCNDSVVTLETWPWSFMNPLHVSKQGHWSAPIGPEFRSCIAVTNTLTDSSVDSLNRFILDSKVEVMYLLTMSPVNSILTKELRNFYTTSKFINFRFKYSLLFSSYIKFHSTKIIRLRYLYLFFVLLYPFLIFGYFFFMIILIGIDLIINKGQVLYEIKKKVIT